METVPTPETPTAEELCADGVMSVREALAFCGFSRAALYREIAAGRLAIVKYGTRTLIPRRGLVLYLASNVTYRGADETLGAQNDLDDARAMSAKIARANLAELSAKGRRP
jgi:hypothetical protein